MEKVISLAEVRLQKKYSNFYMNDEFAYQIMSSYPEVEEKEDERKDVAKEMQKNYMKMLTKATER